MAAEARSSRSRDTNLNTEYPCCGRHLHLWGEEHEAPVVVRTCIKCGITWQVHREILRRHVDGSRVFTLTWIIDVG
jgi:Zn ribbon nucleic-acid-binding protein